VLTPRFALKSLVVAVALVSSLCAAAPTTPYTRMYVFGDSYSDIGAGYVDGNGPTAVAYLGWLMGLQITQAHAPNASDKSLVFAVSGARTGEGEGRHIKAALLGYGMLNQVQDFASRVKSGDIKFDRETTLFFIAGGLNDGGLPTETTIANLRHLIEILRDLGGRHFTVAQLPTRIPQFSQTAIRLDPALQQFAEHEGASLGVDLWLNHWGAGFDDVMEHPESYGIANTEGACAGRAIFDQDATPVGDPATFFFYHEGHPSTAVHRVVGKKLLDEVKAHPPAAR